jgi:hypothetical protein
MLRFPLISWVCINSRRYAEAVRTFRSDGKRYALYPSEKIGQLALYSGDYSSYASRYGDCKCILNFMCSHSTAISGTVSTNCDLVGVIDSYTCYECNATITYHRAPDAIAFHVISTQTHRALPSRKPLVPLLIPSLQHLQVM